MNRYSFKRFILTGSVSFLAMTGAAFASYEEAMQALGEKDYVFAVEEFTRLADKEKNADARYQLGRMYEQGEGVEKDSLKAMQLYQQAAEGGSGQAALKLGNAYYTGKGVGKDYAEALKWYQKAAETGNYSAQYNMGLMLEEGLGTKKDLVKSFEAYSRSGEQGYAPAQIALGRMYLNGSGTPQDFSQAVFWYKLAADQGDIGAQMELANLYSNTSVRGMPFDIVGAHVYYNLVSAYGTSPAKEEAAAKRNALTQKMKVDDVQKAQSNAQKWKKKTREQSLPTDARVVTFLDDASDPMMKKKKKENAKTAVSITPKTDIQDIIVATGIPRRALNKAVRENNFTQIVEELKKKSDKGNKAAQLALADLYMLGQGMKEDPKEAFRLYSELAKSKNAVAFYRLAPMWCEGNGVEPDLAECYKHMLLAKKFADEASMPAIAESLQMLDENLDKEIRDAGKKMADEWGDAKEEKKGLFSFFKSGGDDDDAMKKPTDEEKKDDDDDDMFPDL